MTRKIVLLVVALTTASLLAADASAQLFGERTLGRPLSRQPAHFGDKSVAAARTSGRATAGSFSVPEPNSGRRGKRAAWSTRGARFIRGNRKATDFVGTDTGEAKQFVGSEQAAGTGEEIRSAIDNLNVEIAPDANRRRNRHAARGCRCMPRV